MSLRVEIPKQEGVDVDHSNTTMNFMMRKY